MISYAQNFEDVILWRALGHVDDGFYIDIGAHDPVSDSVSLAFYEKGWRGVHVEPVPKSAENIRRARPDETIIEAAVSTQKSAVELYYFPGTGLSTHITEYAESHYSSGRVAEAFKAKTITLSKLLSTTDAPEIHWLKVDVEGMEEDVLQSWGRCKVRPWIVVVEATIPNSNEPEFENWEHHLLSRDYKFVYFDGLNRFYLHDAHEDLAKNFGAGPNFFDFFTLTENSPFTHGISKRIAELVQERHDREIQINLELETLHRSVAERERVIGDLRTMADSIAANVEDAYEKARVQISSDYSDRLRQLEHSLAEQNQLMGELRSKLSQSEDKNTRIAADFDSMKQRMSIDVVKFESERSALQSTINQLAAHHAVLSNEANALVEKLLSSETRTKDLTIALQSIQSSTSWKIMSPARVLIRLVKQGPYSWVKSVARRLAVIGLWLTRRTPGAKSVVRMAARPFPKIDKKLETFAAVRPVYSGSSMKNLQAETALSGAASSTINELPQTVRSTLLHVTNTFGQ